MQRRKFLVGTGSIAAGGAAVMGSGAYTSATIERSVRVNVVGDNASHLRLYPIDTDWVSQAGNGELSIDFTSSSNGGSGLNPNSRIGFVDLFGIQNQSDTSLVISVGKDKNVAYFNPSDHTNLLENEDEIANTFISNEEAPGGGNPVGSGLAFGSGAASMKTDGTHTYLLDDSQTNKSSARYEVSKLSPGESVNIDLWIFTGDAISGQGAVDSRLVVGAVEPGGDYDETSTGGDSPPAP